MEIAFETQWSILNAFVNAFLEHVFNTFKKFFFVSIAIFLSPCRAEGGTLNLQNITINKFNQKKLKNKYISVFYDLKALLVQINLKEKIRLIII